jgi:hypothetical protein
MRRAYLVEPQKEARCSGSHVTRHVEVLSWSGLLEFAKLSLLFEANTAHVFSVAIWFSATRIRHEARSGRASGINQLVIFEANKAHAFTDHARN